MTTAAKKKTVSATAAMPVAADDWLSVPDLRLDDGQRLAAVSDHIDHIRFSEHFGVNDFKTG